MGGALQPGGALSNRRARRRSRVPMSEINVTPLVDVMLVLLIIFMVTAPLLTVGVDIDAKASLPDVNLPRTEAGQVAPERAPLSITIEADGTLYLQNAQISFEDLAPKLAAIRDAGGTAQVWVRGDTQAAYGDVARVLVRVKEAGLPVTLLTDQVAPR
jgi:biopolymer transport protein TolR